MQMAGIIEEQYPDRARLFMQWKRMHWPILVDSLDLLRVSGIPITLAIDKYGVIRLVNPTLEEFKQKFLNRTFDKPPNLPPIRDTVPDLVSLKQAARHGTTKALGRYADALVEWEGPNQLGEAIEAYQRALRLEPESGPLRFRLGVAYRKRYDSKFRQAEDFQKAANDWSAALEIDPNQYIWRRRLQEFGPRLDKPYPFYYWVATARKEITTRGETPVPLAVEPSGAEVAQPERTFARAAGEPKNPDPEGRILRDDAQFVKIETTVVPGTRAQNVYAVDVTFRPNPAKKTYWNNAAGNLVLWVSPPAGWKVSRHLLTVPSPPQPESKEPRTIEFEVKGPGQRVDRPVTFSAYALYYVCEMVNGVCMYRRQDVPITITPHELK